MTGSRKDPLRNVKVASPCSADWDGMFGNDRIRFCSDCKLNVYNLSNMRRIDAERLLANAEGRLCVRYYRRADGTILTADCPVGVAAIRQRVTRVASAVAGVVLGFLSGITGAGAVRALASTAREAIHDRPLMGDIVSPLPRAVEVQGAIAVLGDLEPSGQPQPVVTLKHSRNHPLTR